MGRAEREEFLRVPAGENNHDVTACQFGDDKPPGVTRCAEDDYLMTFRERR
jgi:hypothetical protein